MSNGNEFNKYATKHLGISSLNMHRFDSVFTNSLTPYIIEERQLNVASMDVFSRLMMDRIIFLGTPIDDYIANIVQAQLLFLESADPSKDIQIYFNTPGGSVHAGLGIYGYHANHFSAILQLFVPEWRLLWEQFCLLPVLMGNALHSNIQG